MQSTSRHGRHAHAKQNRQSITPSSGTIYWDDLQSKKIFTAEEYHLFARFNSYINESLSDRRSLMQVCFSGLNSTMPCENDIS
jgi:hypothetical protein